MAVYDYRNQELEIIYNILKEEITRAYDYIGSKVYEKNTVQLTGISVSYTGGIVPSGTSLNELSGITVTAIYSDGSTKDVDSYILTGILVPGQSNEITVSYQGYTSTFIVEVESEGEIVDPPSTGFRFYVPGVDNAPVEVSIANSVANQNASAWYQAYDNLMTSSNANGNYQITCSLDDPHAPHATATDGVTNLRYYVLTPKSGSYSKTYILHAGTHSTETNALLSCLRICTILCTIDLTSDINPTLKYVCQNVRFIVNPLVNPAMSLATANPNVGTGGVNCNRNYDGWWSRVSGGGGYETGEYPFSEPEMRFVRDTILYFGEDNIHAGLDMHNGATSSEDYWVGYVYNIPQMEQNVRNIVAKCVYDDINGSTTAYLPDGFTDDSGNLVTDMVGRNFTVNGTTYSTPHCMDTKTNGNMTNFGYRAMNLPLHTCEVLKYGKIGKNPGDADVLSKSVKIYMNDILLDCISDYPRPFDTMDTSKPFRISWCGGIQEKYFTTGTEANITNVSPHCTYSFTSYRGIHNGFKYLAKDRKNDFASALATGEIYEMGGTPSNTEDSVSYERLLTQSELQVEGTNGTLGYFILLPKSGTYEKTIVLYGGANSRYTTRISDSNAFFYKFLKIIRDYSDTNSVLNDISTKCRIIVIPSLSASGYPEDMGYAAGNAAQRNLCTLLSDIGTVDLFIQMWSINGSGNGYKYNNTDSDGNTLERLCVRDTGSTYATSLSAMIERMNQYETSRVRYELKGTIWGSSETLKTNSLFHYLYNNGYVIDAVRIMPTIDQDDYRYANERFNVSAGAEGTSSSSMDISTYQKLNGETARRVSVLVNVIKCVLN